jgi:hypothetical protein
MNKRIAGGSVDEIRVESSKDGSDLLVVSVIDVVSISRRKMIYSMIVRFRIS